MTKNQRRYYLTLHAVREMVTGMKTSGKLAPKSRASLARVAVAREFKTIKAAA